MVDPILLSLVESVLGKGKETSRGNYSFVCPFHISNPPGKKNFEVNLITNTKNENPSHCWGCDARHKTLRSLFRHKKVDSSKYEQLNKILGTTYKVDKVKIDIQVELPKEFQPFINLHKNNITGRQALTYLLKNRGISFADIIKHNIGFCETGRYKNKIIIPSYSLEGKVDYFVARAFDDSSHKIDAPKSDKNIIGFESLINWDLPVILVEGPMDALSVKRNSIPLFGKNISEKLRNKLVLNKVKSVYLSLDEDALRNTLKITEELISLGKKVYVVRLMGKDPSAIGFKTFNKLVQNLKPFTLTDLMKLKMEIN